MPTPKPFLNKVKALEEVRLLGSSDEKLQRLDDLLTQDPGSGLFHYERAMVHADVGNLDKARRDLDLATDTAINDPQRFFARGYVNDKLGNHEEAIADYSKAIELKTNRSDCFYLRGLLYLLCGRQDKALADAEECIFRQPTHWEARILLARCLQRKGRTADAADEIKTVLRACPAMAKKVTADGELAMLIPQSQ